MSGILFLDPVGGIAGDMFVAACLDVGAPADALREHLARLGPLGFELRISRDERSSVSGTHVDVTVASEDHPHRSYTEVRRIIEKSALSARVRESALNVFGCLGEAEARVHHKPIEDIHFHEVGAVDSIVDVCGAAVCLELLDWPRVFASPPPAGGGTTRSAHGLIPVPAPATLEIMRGRRMRASGPGERTTPTGAALLATLTQEVGAMPDLLVEKVGYGTGTATFDDAPNVLRAVLGRPAQQHGARACMLVETNLDDATGQILARAIEAAMESGALDAWATPVVGRKGRPAHVLGALVDPGQLEAVRRSILMETPALGVRISHCGRSVLDREWREVKTPWGVVRVKLGRDGDAIVNVSPEYEDCLQLAREHRVPLKQVLQAASAAGEALLVKEALLMNGR